MHPVLFRIPGLDFPIRSFGVMVATGIFLAIWLWGYLLKRYGDDPAEDPNRGSQVALWIVLGIFLGARLMYVTVEVSRYMTAETTPAIERYLDAKNRGAATPGMTQEELEIARKVVVGHDFVHDPFQVIMIWNGGLVMYGGLFGGILAGMWASRRTGLKIWNSFDTALVSSFLGLSIGRWGCLLVGDDYGKIVPEGKEGLPFPITIKVPELDWLRAHTESLFDHDLAGRVLWATQVWMSLNALVIVGVGLWLLPRRSWYGQVGAWLFVHYSITRFLIEMFRGDEIRGVWFNGALSTSQLVSILGFLVGVLLLVKRPGPDAPPRESA